MLHCNKSKHIKSQIINSTKDFTWFYCSNCSLLYSDKKNQKNKHYINRLKIFNNFQDANKHEFKNIIKKIKEIANIKDLDWLDYGCGTGSLLNEIKKETKNIIGFEPNKILYRKSKKKYKIKVFNKFSKIDSRKKFNIVFSRNTFKYIDDFPNKIFQISKKIKKNGLFVWRDKYFNYYPLSAMKNKNLNNSHESLITGSYLFKNAILYHLNKNKLEIVYSKFYLDNSFFIIAKKNNKIKNYSISKINLDYFFLKNQYYVELIHIMRMFILAQINILKLIFRKK